MRLCGSQFDDDDECQDASDDFDDGAGAEVDDEEEEEFDDPPESTENFIDEDGEDDEGSGDDDDDESRIKETFAKATRSRQKFKWTIMATGFDDEASALDACDRKWFNETDEVRFRDRHQLEGIIDGAAKWKDRSSKVLVPDTANETKRKLDCQSGHKCDCSLRVVGYENNTPGPDGMVEINKRKFRIEWNGVLHNHVYVSILVLT